MKNEVKTQLLLKPPLKLARKLARDAVRQDCSQQAVVTGILTDHYFCSDCGRPLKETGGGNCQTCQS